MSSLPNLWFGSEKELAGLGVLVGEVTIDVVLADPVGPADPHRGEGPRLHEPGPQTILGKTYAEGGVEQGQAVLADLARHPATAAHVAFKLARHFSADEPSPSLVERLSKRFLDTDGDQATDRVAFFDGFEREHDGRLFDAIEGDVGIEGQSKSDGAVARTKRELAQVIAFVHVRA